MPYGHAYSGHTHIICEQLTLWYAVTSALVLAIVFAVGCLYEKARLKRQFLSRLSLSHHPTPLLQSNWKHFLILQKKAM